MTMMMMYQYLHIGHLLVVFAIMCSYQGVLIESSRADSLPAPSFTHTAAYESNLVLPHKVDHTSSYSYRQSLLTGRSYSLAASIPHSSLPSSDFTSSGANSTTNAEQLSSDALSTGGMTTNTTTSTSGGDRDVVEWVLIPAVTLTLIVALLVGIAIWRKCRQPKQQTKKQVQPTVRSQMEKVQPMNVTIASEMVGVASVQQPPLKVISEEFFSRPAAFSASGDGRTGSIGEMHLMSNPLTDINLTV